MACKCNAIHRLVCHDHRPGLPWHNTHLYFLDGSLSIGMIAEWLCESRYKTCFHFVFELKWNRKLAAIAARLAAMPGGLQNSLKAAVQQVDQLPPQSARTQSARTQSAELLRYHFDHVTNIKQTRASHAAPGLSRLQPIVSRSACSIDKQEQ